MQIFHRGYNVVDAISGNMLRYTMTRPEDGGLDLESMGHYGDSGSGALLEINPDEEDVTLRRHRIVGVKSNGGPAQWGTSHAYTYVGDYHTDWIQANMESLDQVPAEGCGSNDNIYDECRDTNFDADGNMLGDSYGDPCNLYPGNEGWCGNYDTDVFFSNQMCCACGGGEDITDDGEDSDDGTDGGDDGTGPSVDDLLMALEQAA